MRGMSDVATKRPDVELRIPADSAFLAVLRTATAGLAARLDFTLDDIEDLRIAVGEASALVLPEALAGSDLACRFRLRPPDLVVTLTVRCERPVERRPDPFAWQVLTTLASRAELETGTSTFGVRLQMTSTLGPRS